MNNSKINIGVLLVLTLLYSGISFGQSYVHFVPENLNNSRWADFQKETESAFGVTYYIQSDSAVDFHMKIPSDTLLLIQVLRSNFEQQGYKVATDKHGSIFITKGVSIKTELPLGFFTKPTFVSKEELGAQQKSQNNQLTTSKVYIAKTIIIGDQSLKVPNKKCQLSGIVTSSSDGQPIIGGTIFINELKMGTATNEFGYYQLELLPGKHTLTFNSLESIERNVKIDLLSSGKLNITLDQNLYQLQEVEIKSSQNDNVRGTQMGFEKISARMISEIPVVMGERDIIKIALLLPGVTSVGEGASGFNVRGSPSDQNLFVIENTPVYNTAHLFGFFSAFNPDMIDDFTMYKGSIPARFGGRLSSIFDISTKTGNMEKYSARGGISPITARLMVEGPIFKEKVSFIVGLRSTYSDWVLRMVEDPEIRNSTAYFGDVVLGMDAIVNNKNKIKLFSYYSEDRIKLYNSTSYQFQNQGASIDWLHGFSSKDDLNISFAYSDYSFEEENSELEFAAYKQNYRLVHSELKADLNLRPSDKHTINAGVSGILYNLDRGEHLPLDSLSSEIPISFGQEKAVEAAIYLSDEWKITPLITLVGGLRYNLYSYLGPQSVYEYLPNAPMTPVNIADTLHFGDNQPIKTYGGLDFRFSSIFMLNPNLSVKASYNRLHQYIFMLSNTIALSPTDTWKLADYNIEPMVGDQFSVGMYTNFGKNYELSVEGYYKIVNNLVEYKDGADLVTSQVVEQDILQGKLNAYGIETMIKKPFGKLSGWINYTFANSSVLVDNKITGESINFGKRYPSNYDHPHTLNIVANYKVSRRIILSGNLIYSTGRPITYPAAIYYLDGQKILHYTQRNEYRIPDYFRIDVALKLEGNLISKKLLHGVFIFSVYNLTGRKNAYSVYFKSEHGQINGYKMSIFGTQIFSVTYDFKLGNYAD